MSENCCSTKNGGESCEVSSPENVKDAVCPSCKQKGKPVDTLTLKAMLSAPLTQIRSLPYLFCKTENCPVVYYSADGTHGFGENALREKVHQKHPQDDDVFVCYCFRQTPKSIREELETTGKSTVVESITAGIKAGQCACEVRNPEGSCCLGNVWQVVKEAERKMKPPPQQAAGYLGGFFAMSQLR